MVTMGVIASSSPARHGTDATSHVISSADPPASVDAPADDELVPTLALMRGGDDGDDGDDDGASFRRPAAAEDAGDPVRQLDDDGDPRRAAP